MVDHYVHVIRRHTALKRIVYDDVKIPLFHRREAELSIVPFEQLAEHLPDIIKSGNECVIYPVVFFKASDKVVDDSLATNVMHVAQKFFKQEDALVAVAIVYLREQEFAEFGNSYRGQFKYAKDVRGVGGFTEVFKDSSYQYNVIIMKEALWDLYCSDIRFQGMNIEE
jgi:hypothetical protein